MTIQSCKYFIRGLDKTRLVYRDPGMVVNECLNGVYYLILRDFAPLPERLTTILGRLRETPRVLGEGRALILPAEVPPVWAEIALESPRQGVGLAGGLVPQLAEAVPDLKAEVVAAAQAAAVALTDYASWAEQTVLPHAAGQFAAGKALFDEILREDHMVDYQADELLATGWRLYAATEQQMKELAVQLDPGKSVRQLLEEAKQNHPTADNLLVTYRQEMARARQFVTDHDIATIPAGESIRIEPTPAFMRPVIPYAAYFSPGFLEKVQEGSS